MENYPKKRQINRIGEKEERHIVEDLIPILLEEVNLAFLFEYMMNHHHIVFDDKDQCWSYIKSIFNKHQPNCVKCSDKPRHKCSMFTLFCCDCGESIRKKGIKTKLGTTDFKSRMRDNFIDEADDIRREYERLKLKQIRE